MATGTSSLPPDSWNQPHIPSTSRHRAAEQARVPDDWDDDEEEPVSEEVNKRIWEDAYGNLSLDNFCKLMLARNAKAPNPMPELIIAPSATSSNHVVSPPPAAFQPTMRILKRPGADASSKPATPPPSSVESLKEREARYQAARERIFGPDSGASTPLSEELAVDSTSSVETVNSEDRRERTKVPTPSAAIVRHPRGPSTDSAEQTPPRGFDGQRTKPPLSRNSSQTTTES